MITSIKRNSKLADCIQELKQLIMDDLCQDEFHQNVIQSLNEILSDLGSQKLNIYLLSSDLCMAESFHHHLKAYLSSEDNYQFCLQELPAQSLEEKSIAFAALEFQEPEVGKSRQIRYELSSKPVLRVGRNPVCDICIPDQYTRVSGQHLEIYSLLSDTTSAPQWYVQTCNTCKNGTYINGNELTGDHLLQSGDRIILGNKYPTSKSPELVFDCRLPTTENSLENRRRQTLLKLLSCDFLFVIVNYHHELLEHKNKLLEIIALLPRIQTFLVVLDKSIEILEITQHTDNSLAVENFSQLLNSFTKSQLISMQFDRVLTRATSIIDISNEKALSQKTNIADEIKRFETQKSESSRKKVTFDSTSLVKSTSEQKAILLKSVEISLSQSKQDLLDDSLADSIIQKIQEVVGALNVIVIKQGNEKYLELKANNTELNVNDYLTDFCKNELIDWAGEEWKKIRRSYGIGGLEGLIRNVSGILKSMPEISHDNLDWQIKRKLELDEVFQVPLKRISCRVEYREDPIWVYFIKKIRSSVFQVMGILFLLSFLGFSRGSVIKSINQKISSSFFLIAIALGVFAWLIYKLYRRYQKDKKNEMYKASEKIRQELQNYYQRIVKGRFVDKLAQNLKTSLQEEVDRFDEHIKSILEEKNSYFTEARTSEMDPKVWLRDCQSKALKIDRRLRDLQKVKDKLQRLQTNGCSNFE